MPSERKDDITSRERILAAMEHRETDRVAITESIWGSTVARWRQEGLPQDESPQSYFGLELAGTPVDLSFQLEPRSIEETDRYVIRATEYGRVQKSWKGRASTPQLLDFPVKTRQDWEAYRSHLQWNDSRVKWDEALEANRMARAEGHFIQFGGRVGYQAVTTFAPCETIWIAMIDDPEWITDMITTVTDLTVVAFEEMLGRGFEFDGVMCSDDLGYRNGTFFSTDMFRRFVMPVHQRYCDLAHARGLKAQLHSCGNVMAFVPSIIECGYDALNPLEVKAGMDLIQMKKDFGEQLCLVGGIDILAMSHPDPSVIEEEIRTKVTTAKKGGGYIFHSDHSIPDSVSFEQYRRVVDLALKYGAYG